MKKLILILLPLLFVSIPASAEKGFVKGEIEYIRTHDGDVISSWRPPAFWFTLKGVDKAGTCSIWTPSNTVLFAATDSSAYSMILGAFMAGKEVSVSFDDSVKYSGSGHCKARYITLGNPPLLQ
ncbi:MULTISPECIES: hypothetical protein [Vibrio]|uniref:hypothetical protein n=1 Tax=Vibrio TaxID=662 RepID=UPI00058656E2|nr:MULTISPECIES: hypothetical protein [Vibrio]MCM5509577.1 hypothetical protein [Vibrio sp. SCSIO 43169]MDE3899705.1 hypothetical protein [Vibrio sp. CC007]QFT35081.1 hypothetical protein FIU99_01330 [Vibrio sp. THAF64]QGM32980.1 hypothetical protein GGC04_01335 [Vibrio sp. THAF191d]QGN68482.1 hypothetical protein GGC03_01330 [Vibrio sp. THAF191c]